LLESDALERHPIRIVGPGGSGKTLLMQLLALRRLHLARGRGQPIRLLYLVHNAKMADAVVHRLSVLQGMSHEFTDVNYVLNVQTLAEYGRQELGLEDTQIIDPDAYEAKEFQFSLISDALTESMAANVGWVDKGPLFREIRANEALRPVMVRLLMSEISTAIKGHGLTSDEKRYVQSERRLSRLHGVLEMNERRLVFDIFRRYHSVVFEAYRVLDSDDVALSLLGRLRAPIWELKRRDLGFDYVFVDEAQLFNENERRILPLLTKSNYPHVPIVLALDEAQEFYGQSVAGLSALGIENVTSESLSSIHRSTRSIVKLAFFVIQRSTDLFGPDFPDFTGIAEHMEEDTNSLAAHPTIETMPAEPDRLGRFLVKRIRALRKANLRRIAVICYAEQYWPLLLEELRRTDLPLKVLSTRGERLPGGEPVVALSRPAQIGGQEFDAVILIGLEEGLVPPRVIDNDALAGAVEQQALREIYLGITRARYQLKCLVSSDSLPTAVLAEAEKLGLLHRSDGD
jgi:superfamily I DNA/RNA helicase